MLYVVMTGVQPSSVRSMIMGAMAGLAALSGRRRDGVAALAAAASIMLVIDPYVAFDAGFRLSVSAVAGLLIFASLATRWTECALGTRGRRVAAPVALTLVAQTATLPVAIPLFGMVLGRFTAGKRHRGAARHCRPGRGSPWRGCRTPLRASRGSRAPARGDPALGRRVDRSAPRRAARRCGGYGGRRWTLRWCSSSARRGSVGPVAASGHRVAMRGQWPQSWRPD
jgi:hypothetical protein